MSLALYEFGLKLKASDQQKASLVCSHKPVNIRSDALLISIVAMSGEHAGTWAVSVGGINSKKPQKMACVDPSNFYDLVDMWKQLERHISTHFYSSNDNEQTAQIVVANRKTWDILAETAKRLAYSSSLSAFRLAHMILYANDRSYLAGDPTVVCMSELLNQIFVTGEEPEQIVNLQRTLAWVEGGDTLKNMLGEPVEGFKSADEKDDECFLPREQEDNEFYKSYNVARQTHDETRRNNISMKHKVKLLKIVQERWVRLKQAVELYNNLDLETIAQLEEFEAMSYDSLKYFLKILAEDEQVREKEIADQKAQVENLTQTKTTMLDVASSDYNVEETSDKNKNLTPNNNSFYSNKKLGRYDSALTALNKLSDRIEHNNEWEKVLVWNDRHHRQKLFANGQIIQGTVTDVTLNGFCVEVHHDMLRVREGEELYSFQEPKNKIQILRMQRNMLNTSVWVSAYHEVTEGDFVMYGPSPPDPSRIKRNGFSRRSAYKKVGWTHKKSVEPPPLNVVSPPVDLLKQVNSERSD